MHDSRLNSNELCNFSPFFHFHFLTSHRVICWWVLMHSLLSMIGPSFIWTFELAEFSALHNANAKFFMDSEEIWYFGYTWPRPLSLADDSAIWLRQHSCISIDIHAITELWPAYKMQLLSTNDFYPSILLPLVRIFSLNFQLMLHYEPTLTPFFSYWKYEYELEWQFEFVQRARVYTVLDAMCVCIWRARMYVSNQPFYPKWT